MNAQNAADPILASEERFRLLAESNPSILWTACRDGRPTYVSERWYQYTGVPRDEGLRPQRWSVERLHPEDRERVNESWRAAVAAGAEHEVEVRLLRADGVYRWFVVRAAPVKDKSGAVVQWFGSTTDIDDRRQSEDSARFVASAGQVLAEMRDYERALVRVSELAVPAFADWFGVHLREPDGYVRRLAVKHSDPGKERLVEEMYRRYPPGEGKPYGARAVMAMNEPVFAADFAAAAPEVARDARHLEMLLALGLRSFLCVPMRSGGRVVGALTFATAESRRVYSGTHLRAAEDLASRAAANIENTQLVEALREADKRKDEFLAMLAHELRNPLAPMRNAVHILRERTLAIPEAQWANDVLERQVRQMARLVDDLLDVSRIASGKIELRRERVALALAIQGAVESCRPAIERGRHMLEVKLPPEPVHVDADLARLTQIVSNLLSNAAKYTNPGGHIRVAAEREAGMAVIRVIDDGIGIPPPMLRRVFDMFTQLDQATDYSHGGLGIGLTLVRQLAELHGGTATAHSEGRGRGSEFVVRLPAIVGPDAEAAQPPAGDAGHAGGARVLVVDDNRDAADSLGFVLGLRGCEVRVAYSGEEGLQAASEQRPDVVLLDIGMPKMAGHEVAKHLRDAYGRQLLIVAVTGWGQEEDRRMTRASGFDHHFTKPVDLQALLPLIREAAAAR